MVQKLNFYFTSRSSFTSHGGHSLCLLNSKVSYPLFLYDWQGTNVLIQVKFSITIVENV